MRSLRKGAQLKVWAGNVSWRSISSLYVARMNASIFCITRSGSCWRAVVSGSGNIRRPPRLPDLTQPGQIARDEEGDRRQHEARFDAYWTGHHGRREEQELIENPAPTIDEPLQRRRRQQSQRQRQAVGRIRG